MFGDYIDVYDIQRAVEDGATVRIYYEGRLAKIELKEKERPKIDPRFEEITERRGSRPPRRSSRSKWARLEAMVGSDKRIKLIAKDIVDHWERRLDAMDGKAMIVCMSRRICVDLYNAIVKLRPEWHNADDDKGVIKVVMTGSASDPLTLAAAYSEQESARRAREAVQEPGGSAEARDRPRHVADRVRRSLPAHDVRR